MKDILQNKFHRISFSGKWFLALLAVGMISAAGIGSANAYFTTYAEARGGVTIRLGDESDITERFAGWRKTVVIDSMKGSEPVWVRVKAFCGSEYKLIFDWNGTDWSADPKTQGPKTIVENGDKDFYYCTSILYASDDYKAEEGEDEKIGGKTPEIWIDIRDKDGNEIKIQDKDGNMLVNPEDAQAFNVVVIYESTPVLYDEDGNAYADWTQKLETGYPEEEESEVSGDDQNHNQ